MINSNKLPLKILWKSNALFNTEKIDIQHPAQDKFKHII